MNSKILGLAAILVAVGTAHAINFPYGTYVYAGSVRNYRNEVMEADSGVVIQAVKTNGVVLATTTITAPTASGLNYRLEVPVSSESSDRSAALGEVLNCVIVNRSRAVSSEPLPPVAEANAVKHVNLLYATATELAYGTNGTVQVSDEYLTGMGYLMRAYGYDRYDPAADWDGDGADNYSEYRAGTNPFDASDRLRITAFGRDSARVALQFEYAGGHVYGLKAARTLDRPDWMTQRFKVDAPDASDQEAVVKNVPDDEVGVMTLYVAPEPDAASGFYKIEVK